MGKKSRRRNFVKKALKDDRRAFADITNRNPGIARKDLLLQQIMEKLPGPNDPEAMAAFMNPDPVNKASLEATKLLPLSDEVWFADYRVNTSHGVHVITIMIHLVEKEHKSNGAILPESDGLSYTMGASMVRKLSNESFEGLMEEMVSKSLYESFESEIEEMALKSSNESVESLMEEMVLKFSNESIDESSMEEKALKSFESFMSNMEEMRVEPPNENFMEEIPYWLVGTIIKACRKPCNDLFMTNVSPHRPRKILFRSAGIMNATAFQVEEMGIQEAGVAEAGLVESVQSYIAREERNTIHTSASDCTNTVRRYDPRRIVAKLQKGRERPYCDENEPHCPLANWTEPAKSTIGATPLEWFVKLPPTTADTYEKDQLWGWRSNLQAACKLGDDAKIVQLGTTYPACDVRSFCEQQLLLTNAAHHGMLSVCKALLKHCHCHPDGVQSPTNNVEWEALQHENGSPCSYTPLHFAAREGHKKIVQLLIKHGANLNLVDNGGSDATALYYAAFGGHQNICKLLCAAGADRSIQSSAGCNPIEAARSVLLSDLSKRLHVASVVEIAEYDVQEEICGACGTGGALQKCPCGFQVYCDKECQISMWQKHKTEHKLHLSGATCNSI